MLLLPLGENYPISSSATDRRKLRMGFRKGTEEIGKIKEFLGINGKIIANSESYAEDAITLDETIMYELPPEITGNPIVPAMLHKKEKLQQHGAFYSFLV